jgi:hypothetical protein
MHVIAEPLATLWDRTRAMLVRALAAIGAPEAIAAMRVLTEERRRAIALWLGLIEHIVRKLLLAEAAMFAPKEAPRTAGFQPAIHLSQTSPQRSKAPRASRSIDRSQAETWPAHFSLALPRDPLAVPESRAPRIRALWGNTPTPAKPLPARKASERDVALNLAFRLEALRRVLADPAPHAQRLARLLLRLRRRFPEVIQRFVVAPARVSFYDERDPRLSIDAMSMGMDGAIALSDSS